MNCINAECQILGAIELKEHKTCLFNIFVFENIDLESVQSIEIVFKL